MTFYVFGFLKFLSFLSAIETHNKSVDAYRQILNNVEHDTHNANIKIAQSFPK